MLHLCYKRQWRYNHHCRFFMSDMHDTHNEYTSNAVVKCQKKRYNTKVLNKYKCTKTTIVVLYGIIHA